MFKWFKVYPTVVFEVKEAATHQKKASMTGVVRNFADRHFVTIVDSSPASVEERLFSTKREQVCKFCCLL